MANVEREGRYTCRELANFEREGKNKDGELANVEREGRNIDRELANVEREGRNKDGELANFEREGRNIDRESANVEREGRNITRSENVGPSEMEMQDWNILNGPSHIVKTGNMKTKLKIPFPLSFSCEWAEKLKISCYTPKQTMAQHSTTPN